MGESIESNNSGDIVVTMRKRDEFKWISMGEEMVNRDLKKVVGSGVGNKFSKKDFMVAVQELLD